MFVLQWRHLLLGWPPFDNDQRRHGSACVLSLSLSLSLTAAGAGIASEQSGVPRRSLLSLSLFLSLSLIQWGVESINSNTRKKTVKKSFPFFLSNK
jgi:hypothetical protein